VSANVLAESNVGMIITDGDPTSNNDNTVMGLDFRYLNTRLASGRQLEGDAWYQKSDTPGLDGRDAAYGFGFRMPNNTGLRAGMGFREVQQNFYPAMGFVSRTNIRDYTADVGYTHFFDGGPFQTWSGGADMQRINLIDGGLQSQVELYRLVELSTNQRDNIQMSFTRNREVVRAPFTVYREPGRTVSIQPGDYSFSEWAYSIGTGNQREFSGSAFWASGSFYNGDHDNIGVNFNWNQSRWFQLGLNYNWDDIRLPQGDFTVRLARLNTQVAFSSTLFWVSLVQYDNVSEQLGINTRLQWIPKAGQEGFVVLNYGMEDQDKDNHFHSATADVSVKFKYTFRF
jgi:hypothetical protein